LLEVELGGYLFGSSESYLLTEVISDLILLSKEFPSPSDEVEDVDDLLWSK
jgi:hypothetical protein